MKKSVETLSDTAEIDLPAVVFNQTLEVEDKIGVGDAVEIKFGYDGANETEFSGYVSSLKTDEEKLTIACTDGLYHFKKPVKDLELKKVRLKQILEQVIEQVNAQSGTKYGLQCDYDCGFDKFVFCHATGYDVLGKIQDELKANIYFEGNTLHVTPPYATLKNKRAVVFDYARNIEQSNLKYRKAADKNLEVEVKTTLPNGESKTAKFGTTGGDKKTKIVNGVTEADLLTLAKAEYNVWCYDGYEGDYTGWLIPYVEPAYQVRIKDKDYPEKEGCYYVIATETTFGQSGGKRKVTLGRKVEV